MGTFTMATGFGMLAVGLIVIAVMGTVGFIVVNIQQKKKQDSENKSSIQRQLERLRR
tara:strand:+ start:413 stop:583 length:171 start_codon:yes stop_codon:yes gene_type:complete